MGNNEIGIEAKIIRKEYGFFMSPNSWYDKSHTVYDVRDDKFREMNVYEAHILGYLLRCCNNGGSAFPSYSKIAQCCRISRRTAIRSITNLEHSGYITKKNRGYNKENQSEIRRYSNVYVVNWEKLEE